MTVGHESNVRKSVKISFASTQRNAILDVQAAFVLCDLDNSNAKEQGLVCVSR